MDFTNVLTLFGGAALFLFGMNLMGDALEKSAGNKLKGILGKMTASPLRGFLLGAGVTAVIQSSSATTVMLVGFVNSGIMSLSSVIPVIMGANVGTTITAWILSLTGIEGESFLITMLKPSSFTPILAVIGVVLYIFLKNPKRKDIGLILLGFSVLIFGMDIMSDAIAPLADLEWFRNLFVMFENPLFGLLIGAVVTAIIQSSSASVGILQALAGELNTAGAAPAITVGMTIPIIMGQNIGTCVTAVIGSVGANKDAKRVAAVHLCFNIIGSTLLLALYCLLQYLIIPGGMAFAALGANESTIAIVHTVFNITCTAILLPCYKLLEKMAYLIVRDKADGGEESKKTVLFDDRLLETPFIAIERARSITVNMAKCSKEAIVRALSMLDEFEQKNLDIVERLENEADFYEDEIGSYLVKITGYALNESDSHEVSKLLHMIGDLERLSDHAVSIAKSSKEMYDKRISFSENAKDELRVLADAITEAVTLAIKSFEGNDLDAAIRVEPLEEAIDRLSRDIKVNHINRLKNNECTIELGFILTDILTNLERIADHSSNVAGCVIEISNNSLGMHSYSQRVKAGDVTFDTLLREYSGKYSILPSLK